MSSPTTTTPVSRSISCAIPSAMARAVVSLRPDCPAGAPSAEEVVSVALIGLPPSREDVVKRRLRRGNRAGLGELDRLLDPGRCLVLDGLGRVRVQDAGLRQPLLIGRDRVLAGNVGQLGAVGLRVTLEMTPQPQRVDLEQGRPLPGPRPGDRVTGRRVDGFHVVVVDPLAGYAVGGGPVGVGWNAGGDVAWHRDRPVVVR